MYEELFYDKETLSETQQKKIFRVNTQIQRNRNDIHQTLLQLEMNCVEHDENALVQILSDILGSEGSFLEKNLKGVTHALFRETI